MLPVIVDDCHVTGAIVFLLVDDPTQCRPSGTEDVLFTKVLLAAGHEGGALLEPERLLEDKRR